MFDRAGRSCSPAPASHPSPRTRLAPFDNSRCLSLGGVTRPAWSPWRRSAGRAAAGNGPRGRAVLGRMEAGRLPWGEGNRLGGGRREGGMEGEGGGKRKGEEERRIGPRGCYVTVGVLYKIDPRFQIYHYFKQFEYILVGPRALRIRPLRFFFSLSESGTF